MNAFDGLPGLFLGQFGQPVTLYDEMGEPHPTTGIFRRRSSVDLGVVQDGAILHLADADAAILKDGNNVLIDGRWYFARAGEPDGFGMTPCSLEVSHGPEND